MCIYTANFRIPIDTYDPFNLVIVGMNIVCDLSGWISYHEYSSQFIVYVSNDYHQRLHEQCQFCLLYKWRMPFLCREGMDLVLDQKLQCLRRPSETWRSLLQNVYSVAHDSFDFIIWSSYALIIFIWFDITARPPNAEVQDGDNSSQAIKRRLPPEIKQKLAKVARYAVLDKLL